jgi:hypothetical protein
MGHPFSHQFAREGTLPLTSGPGTESGNVEMNYTSFKTDSTVNAHCGRHAGRGFGGHVALPDGFVISK